MTAPAVVSAIMLALVVVLMVSPVRLHVELDTGGERIVRWRLHWLVLRVSGPGSARSVTDTDRERRARRRRREALPPGGGARRVRAALGTPGLLRRVRRLAADLGFVLLPDALQADLRVGLSDPAETGVLTAGSWR
ncbi:MAG: hypothetical protein R2712_05640 [Vicinamibacterales bacterium]